MIQKQLMELVCEWNHHRIRHSRNVEAPGGIPEMLYFLPEQTGGYYNIYITLSNNFCRLQSGFYFLTCRDPWLQVFCRFWFARMCRVIVWCTCTLLFSWIWGIWNSFERRFFYSLSTISIWCTTIVFPCNWRYQYPCHRGVIFIIHVIRLY